MPISHFELFQERKATDISLYKIIVEDSVEKINEKEVVLSDLDIVNHVNNVKYLEWCLDYVTPELILNQKIKSIEMNFLKELSKKIWFKSIDKRIQNEFNSQFQKKLKPVLS